MESCHSACWNGLIPGCKWQKNVLASLVSRPADKESKGLRRASFDAKSDASPGGVLPKELAAIELHMKKSGGHCPAAAFEVSKSCHRRSSRLSI
eukprot:4435168-Amphidinium_carterae.1